MLPVESREQRPKEGVGSHDSAPAHHALSNLGEAGAFFEWASLMTVSAYRLTGAITALIAKDSRERLGCLAPGSILIPTSETDAAGMIAAQCDNLFVRVFDRDIQEQTEQIEIETV